MKSNFLALNLPVSSTPALHASRAINANDFAIHPLAILASQEGRNSRDIDRHADPVARGPRGRILVNLLVVQVVAVGDILFAHCVVHVGLDATGRNGIDGDLLVAAVDGHATDERLDRALAARVDGMFRHALRLARDAAHENDAPAHLEDLVRLAGYEELAAGVDVHDAVVFLFCDVLQVTKGDDAAVGDDNVDFAERLLGPFHEADDLLDVADVGLDGDGIGGGDGGF